MAGRGGTKEGGMQEPERILIKEDRKRNMKTGDQQMKIAAFWGVTLHSLVEMYHVSEEPTASIVTVFPDGVVDTSTKPHDGISQSHFHNQNH